MRRMMTRKIALALIAEHNAKTQPVTPEPSIGVWIEGVRYDVKTAADVRVLQEIDRLNKLPR